MSRNGQQDAGVWHCICGRQVPARFGECYCGVTRDQALAVAKAAQPAPRKPLTLLGLSLRLGVAAIVIVVGVAAYLVYSPSAVPPVPASPSATPLLRSQPSPVASPTPSETLPPWSRDSPDWEPPPAPPIVVEPRPPAPEPPSEADLLRAKAEQWRGRYRRAAERVARLQKDVVLLEAGFVPYDENNPGRNADIRRMNDLLQERLDAARKELEQARLELTDIEENARQDGVLPGQLR